ncbi:MAG: SH3 domain-containing protein [Oceanipulchritudo sp.]
MTKGTRFRVLADYEVHDPHPLQLPEGSEVTILRSDMSWPGWLWVKAGRQTGWIPASCLTVTSPGPGRTSQAFDGTELSARCGEILEGLEEAPGWVLARRATGETGWFPLFNLKPHQHT